MLETTLWRRMKVVITVNDYKEVRRRWLNGESQRSIARAMGISRNTVKKYCEGENVPWERKEYLRAPSVLTPEVQAFIAAYLKADAEEGTSKQQHTAKRIYDRLVDEMGFTGGESTIRAYVSACKGSAKEAFVPLAFAPGDALQIDWGEVTIVLAGVKKVVYLFCARLCYSEAPLCRSVPETEQRELSRCSGANLCVFWRCPKARNLRQCKGRRKRRLWSKCKSN